MMMNWAAAMLAGGALVGGTAAVARGQTAVFSQAMMANGGTARQSCFWVDPSGQNDLDSDTKAWEDFTLVQSATVTQVRWWGEALPPLGFTVSFYNQDPGTIASQPDIFRAGAHAISTQTFAAPSVQSAGGGMYQYTVNLSSPLTFTAGTRYFVSVLALTPVPYAGWAWAQGTGAGTTFWWSRGAARFFSIAGNRALELRGTVEAPACAADFNADGTLNPDDLADYIGAYFSSPAAAGADFNADGVVDPDDLADFIGAFFRGC